MSQLKRMWPSTVIVMVLVGLLATACGSKAPLMPAAAGDRPTMLYFYTDN